MKQAHGVGQTKPMYTQKPGMSMVRGSTKMKKKKNKASQFAAIQSKMSAKK